MTSPSHERLQASAAAKQPNWSGRRLGDYQLLRRLGRGGMAEVYLAEQASLRREVALKILHSNLAEDETYVRRFHHEAQAAAALVHANIVQIYEVGCIERVHFIAQEYVPGQNLKQALLRRGPLDFAQAISIMRQVAAALGKANSRGIIHRDVKPENIMLSPAGEVKVADFGLARVASQRKQLGLTQVGVTMGTPLYMSPEQLEGRELDHRTDLYSLGVSSYEMLSGRLPFEADTSVAVALRHLKDTPRPLAELRPDLPPALCQLVHRLLAKQPADRPRDAQLVWDELGTMGQAIGTPLPVHVTCRALQDTPTLADARTATTHQLQVAMRAEAAQPAGRPLIWRLLLLWACAATLGAAVAWLARPRPLLEVPAESLPRIERQESAARQFEYALELSSERAFLSVLEHFPAGRNPRNELYGYKAQLHLAYLYEDADRTDEALQLYGQLAEQDLDHQLQAIGLIGRANIYIARGDRTQANRQLFQIVKQVRNRGRLASRTRQEWIRRLNPRLRSEFRRQLGDFSGKLP